MARPAARARRKWVSYRDSPLIIVRRGWALCRQEGLTALLSGARRFVGRLLQTLYSVRLMRMYRMTVAEAAEVPVKAPLENLHLRIMESRDDALRLAEEGFENILESVPGAERKLRGGAVAVCAFLGDELASIDWMALTKEAKRVVDSFPYPADFTAGDACTGGAFTMPHLRGRGIAAYRFSAQVAYLHARGVRACYNAITVDNIPSQRTVERYGATFDAVFRGRVLLGRRSFKQVWSRDAQPSVTGGGAQAGRMP